MRKSGLDGFVHIFIFLILLPTLAKGAPKVVQQKECYFLIQGYDDSKKEIPLTSLSISSLATSFEEPAADLEKKIINLTLDGEKNYQAKIILFSEEYNAILALIDAGEECKKPHKATVEVRLPEPPKPVIVATPTPTPIPPAPTPPPPPETTKKKLPFKYIYSTSVSTGYVSTNMSYILDQTYGYSLTGLETSVFGSIAFEIAPGINIPLGVGGSYTWTRNNNIVFMLEDTKNTNNQSENYSLNLTNTGVYLTAFTGIDIFLINNFYFCLSPFLSYEILGKFTTTGDMVYVSSHQSSIRFGGKVGVEYRFGAHLKAKIDFLYYSGSFKINDPISYYHPETKASISGYGVFVTTGWNF